MSTEAADYVVIGSGAAGATAALVLAEAGRDVLVLEEGPRVTERDRGLGPTEALLRLFRDGGTQVAMGRSVIPILQGRCVGGTTVVNGAIIWRLPEAAYDRVFRAVGAAEAIPLRELERCFDRIERDLGVAETPEARLGNNGRLMRLGAERLGLRGHVIRRNVVDCRGSSRCLEACPTRQKQSLEVTYLPRAEALGARIRPLHEVRRIEPLGGRARLVSGRTAEGGEFRIEARRGVILAASAVQSPGLLERSGLGGGHVGRHFRAHPATAMTGVYRDPVRLWEGGAQTYEVDHFREEGFKLETTALPVELTGVRLSLLGRAFRAAMAEYGHMAVFGAQVRAEAEGTVAPFGLRARITYSPSAEDMARFRRAARILAELHFAAGAVRVFPGIHGAPEVLESVDEAARLDDVSLDPRAWSLISSHVFGTCRMAREARDGVVDFGLRAHGVDGLWILDASVFPTNLGVNPQHAIMALAMLTAERIAAE